MKGTRDATEIILESLGKDIVYALSSQEELEKKQEYSQYNDLVNTKKRGIVAFFIKNRF